MINIVKHTNQVFFNISKTSKDFIYPFARIKRVGIEITMRQHPHQVIEIAIQSLPYFLKSKNLKLK